VERRLVDVAPPRGVAGIGACHRRQRVDVRAEAAPGGRSPGGPG
jgi:hypothetical protein